MTTLIEMYKAMINKNARKNISNTASAVEYKFRDIPSLRDLSDEDKETVGRSIRNIKKPMSMLDVLDI